MKNALILHGTDADHTTNWFEWLGKELEKEGYKVWIPDLPHSEKPNIQRYNEFILSNKDWIFDEDSIIIGHSSGAVAILGLLQALPKDVVIRKAYLVAAFTDDLGWDSLTELFLSPFDYQVIKTHSHGFTLLHADNDPYCPLWHAETIAKELNGELMVEKGQGHFSASKNPSYTQFPILRDLIIKDQNSTFEFEGTSQSTSFVETVDVKTGVQCDVYTFNNHKEKDLGIIHLAAGCKTPLQRVLQGDRTIEGYISGRGKLVITRADGTKKEYIVDEITQKPFEVNVAIGETMQWQADADSQLEAYEICFPPYRDGRYENLPDLD